MARLTNTVAAQAKPRAKVYDIQDEIPGFALRVTPGGAKTWTVRYRNTSGALRRYRLGAFRGKDGGMSADEARKAALRVLGAVNGGEDPQAERESQRKAETVADLARWYLDVYVQTAGRNGGAKTPRSIGTDTGYVNKHILERRSLARKPVTSVDRRDVEAIKRDAAPGAFRKVRAILRIMFRQAEEQGLQPPGTNPTARVRAAPERRVERYLTRDEWERLEDVLEEAASIGPKRRGHVSPAAIAAIRLLAITGMRRGEVTEILRWGHVDWQHQCLRLPTSKTGQKVVPLSSAALAFLRGLHDGQPSDQLVISGPDGTPLANLTRTWLNVRRRAGLEDVRLHDLRHNFASACASAGVPLAAIGALLGHRHVSTTQRYAHLTDEALRDAAERAGLALSMRLGGGGGDLGDPGG